MKSSWWLNDDSTKSHHRRTPPTLTFLGGDLYSRSWLTWAVVFLGYSSLHGQGNWCREAIDCHVKVTKSSFFRFTFFLINAWQLIQYFTIVCRKRPISKWQLGDCSCDETWKSRGDKESEITSRPTGFIYCMYNSECVNNPGFYRKSSWVRNEFCQLVFFFFSVEQPKIL